MFTKSQTTCSFVTEYLFLAEWIKRNTFEVWRIFGDLFWGNFRSIAVLWLFTYIFLKEMMLKIFWSGDFQIFCMKNFRQQFSWIFSINNPSKLMNFWREEGFISQMSKGLFTFCIWTVTNSSPFPPKKHDLICERPLRVHSLSKKKFCCLENLWPGRGGSFFCMT